MIYKKNCYNTRNKSLVYILNLFYIILVVPRNVASIIKFYYFIFYYRIIKNRIRNHLWI